MKRSHHLSMERFEEIANKLPAADCLCLLTLLQVPHHHTERMCEILQARIEHVRRSYQLTGEWELRERDAGS